MENSNNDPLRQFVFHDFTPLHELPYRQICPAPSGYSGMWIGCRLISTKELRWSKKKRHRNKENKWMDL